MLEKYLELLIEANSRMNLTAIRDPAEIRVRHFEDSIKLLDAADFRDKKLLDIGSGAGLPGLPLKISEPSIDLTLLDSTGKKVDFLRAACDSLGLTDVKTICARAEELAHTDARETFDVVTARGVASFGLLAELALPFVKVGGIFLAMKETAEEAQEKLVTELGGTLLPPYRYTLSDGRTHFVIITKKIKNTPIQLPRSWGKMKKGR